MINGYILSVIGIITYYEYILNVSDNNQGHKVLHGIKNNLINSIDFTLKNLYFNFIINYINKK